jgi:hypothetical protein
VYAHNKILSTVKSLFNRQLVKNKDAGKLSTLVEKSNNKWCQSGLSKVRKKEAIDRLNL